MKKALKIIIIVVITLLLLPRILLSVLTAVTPMVMSYVRTDVSELQELHTEFESMPVESCEFVNIFEMYIPFGGVLEMETSGKVKVTDEYYCWLLENYSWESGQGMPRAVSDFYDRYSYKKLDDFLNEGYLCSEDFQEDKNVKLYLSPDTSEIYFYYRSL